VNSEKYILVKGYEGLGVRLFCLVTAILYGKLSKRRVIVDWRDEAYSDGHSNLFTMLYDLKDGRGLENLQLTASVAPGLWTNNLHQSQYYIKKKLFADIPANRTVPAIELEKCSINPKKTRYKEDVVVMISFFDKINNLRKFFTGQFAHLKKMSREEIFRNVYWDNLVLKKNLRDKINDFKNAHFKGKIIGVHSRQSDLKISKHKIYLGVEEAFRKIPNASIFLATDNKEFEAEFGERYQNVFYASKILPEGGKSVLGNVNFTNRSQALADALVDLHLLSDCDAIVYCRRSTFSTIAAWLSPAPMDNKIDVDKYWDGKGVKKTYREKIRIFKERLWTKYKNLSFRAKYYFR